MISCHERTARAKLLSLFKCGLRVRTPFFQASHRRRTILGQKALGCKVVCIPYLRCKHFFFIFFFFSVWWRPCSEPSWATAPAKPELQKSWPRLPLPEGGCSDSAFAAAKGKREGPAGDLPVGQRGARCWEAKLQSPVAKSVSCRTLPCRCFLTEGFGCTSQSFL